MDHRAQLDFLHRRAGFGLSPLDRLLTGFRSPSAEIERLVDPDAHGVAPVSDPWPDDDYALEASSDPATAALQRRAAIDAWLDRLVATTRPLHDWMAWYWHGRLVSGLDKVRVARPMINQIRLLQQGAMGDFGALMRAVTVDPAMLVYLDGAGSDQASPNENYSREFLELFTLGLGNYTEADVQAGARALTGWRVRRRDAVAVFDRRGHDDTPQAYLGTTVHDVDTVVAAATGHPACAPFVAGKLARAILGRDVDATLVAGLSQQFADGGLELQPLLRAILQAGIDGRAGPTPVVLAPVPWLVQAQRMTGAVLDPRLRLAGLRSAGQVPMLPPNVAGWPGGAAWFTSATIVARTQLASAVASATTPDNAAAGAAQRSDLDALAFWLGIAGDFGRATRDAILDLADWRSRLVVALVSPEFVLV